MCFSISMESSVFKLTLFLGTSKDESSMDSIITLESVSTLYKKQETKNEMGQSTAGCLLLIGVCCFQDTPGAMADKGAQKCCDKHAFTSICSKHTSHWEHGWSSEIV
jgi:hypothetical protein